LSSTYLAAGDPLEVKRLELQAKFTQEELGAALKLLGFKPGLSVLEVGCGSGVVSREVAKRISPSKLTAIDVDPVFLEKARQLADVQRIKNISFQQTNVNEMRFPDQEFDVSFCNLVLMHLARPLDALLQMKRVTRKGGKVAVSEADHDCGAEYPTFPKMEEIGERIRSWQAEHKEMDPKMGRKLASLFVEAGFEKLEIHPFTGCISKITNPDLFEIATEQGRTEYSIMKPKWLAQGLCTESEFDLALQELTEFAKDPGAFISWTTFLAIGEV
jgi:ubiquinone/menaquinone biosynthesis C-methylase UbiE